MSQRVFIIVLNYNNWADTVDCLESLMRLEYPHENESVGIVAVDNASSTDASAFQERRQGFERGFGAFSFIQTGKNLGYAGGNNIGIRRALEQGAEWILILNNDTIVPPDLLRRLFWPQCNDFGNHYIGVLGAKILEPDGKLWALGGRFNWDFFSMTRGILNTRHQPSAISHKPISTDYVSGTAMLVHRSVFETIGLLPEEYFLYYEDFEFCLKARRAGFFVGVVPEALLYHKVSKSTQAGSPLYVYYHFRNSLLFARRNIEPPLRWIIYCFSLWWALKQVVKLLMPSRRINGWAGLRGMRDFWYGRAL